MQAVTSIEGMPVAAITARSSAGRIWPAGLSLASAPSSAPVLLTAAM